MNIKLIANWYTDKNLYRQKELLSCLKKNLENPYITQIHLWAEADIPIKSDKIQLYHSNFRPTYRELISLSDDDAVNVVANTDILFDETIRLTTEMPQYTIYALSRWELGRVQTQFHRNDSQDCWIFKSKLSITNPHLFNYTMGKPGCDNRAAFDFKQIGFNVFNPCKDIRAWHNHTTRIRNYNPFNVADRVPPPYAKIEPCTLAECLI